MTEAEYIKQGQDPSIPIEVIREPPRIVPDPTGTRLLTNSYAIKLIRHVRKLGKEFLKYVEKNLVEMESPAEILIRLKRESLKRLKSDVERIVKIGFNSGRNKAAREMVRDNILSTPILPDSPVNDEYRTIFRDLNLDLVTNLSDQLYDKLRHLLTRAILDGWTQKQISRAIQGEIGRSERSAKAIARTEIIRMHNTGRVRAFVDAGVKYVQWSAALERVKKGKGWKKKKGKRTCLICYKLHGKIVRVGTTFNRYLTSKMQRQIKWMPIHKPPDPHPNCRCTIRSAHKPEKKRIGPKSEEDIRNLIVRDDQGRFAKRVRGLPAIHGGKYEEETPKEIIERYEQELREILPEVKEPKLKKLNYSKILHWAGERAKRVGGDERRRYIEMMKESRRRI